jgi:hypothetical protein
VAVAARLVGPVFCFALAFLGACNRDSSVDAGEAFTSDADSIANVRRDSAVRARQDAIVRSRPGYIIDSILPVEEEIRRFQASSGERPAGFANGATSRSVLVAELVRAIERNDTTALTRLVIDRAEFAYLVYPTSPNVAPPYRQSPDLVWLTRSAATDKGLRRLLGRFGGRPLAYAGFTCADSVDRQGANTLWSGCAVQQVAGGDTTRLRMFGPIVRRDGRFKFLSLANGL